MAENLDVNVNVNTSQAQSNINSLNNSLKGLDSTFAALKTAVAGIAFGAMLRDINSFSLSMVQVNKSTEISLQTIGKFSKAVGSLGGDAQKAVGDVQDFVAGLYDAKQGSAGAQAELSKIGVTLEDLATLSNEDIFKKTIDGLAKIEDSSTRNALAVKMLGKNFKDLDIRSVQQAMAAGSAGANTSAVQAAADAQIALTKNLNNLKEALTNVVEPLNNIAKSINISATAFESLIKVVLYAGAAYLALTRGLGAVTSIMNVLEVAITKAGGLWAWITGLLTLMYKNVIQVFTNLGRMIGILGGATSATFSFAAAIAAILRLLLRFTGVVGIILAVAEAVNFLSKQFLNFDIIDTITTKIGNLYDKAKGFFGLGNQGAGAGRGNGQAELDARAKHAEENAKKEEAARKRVIDAHRAQLLEVNKVIQAYQTQNGLTATQLQFQNTLIGKDEDYAAQQTKMFEVQMAYVGQINQLRQKYLDMQAAAASGTDEEKAAFAAFGKVYQGAIDQINTEYQNQRKIIQSLLNQEMVLKAAEKDRQNVIEQITKQLERQAALGDILRATNDKMTDMKFNISMIGREGLDREFAQLQEDLRKQALEASRTFAANFEGLDLSTEQANELAKGLDEIAQRYKTLNDLLNKQMVLTYAEKDRQNNLEQINKQLERQITLADQLKSANDKLVDVKFAGTQQGRNPFEKQMAQIQEDARKAALEAGRTFAAGFEGMDLTVEQSKELADGLEQIAERYRLIAEEQTKQLQASRTFEQGWKTAFDNYIDNATNAAVRAGEVFSSITRNMESAIDKFVETGKFSFSDLARSIIQDMIKIELKAQASKILGAIGGGGGLFSAIGSIFGFAEGGNPPINKPSLVGENGPELFVPKTAGTVVPNGMLNGMGAAPVHNTYITNNISAIDSKSVAQLFAENRKTLLGTVQLAQKELPYGNR